MTNPIERTAAAMQRAMAASPEERERLRQAAEELGAEPSTSSTPQASRFATGGFIEGGPMPRLSECVISVHPDECFIRAADVAAGRWVCSRPDHPTATSDCVRKGDLRALCRARGLADEDSDRAISAYFAAGGLTATDRARLAGMSDVERATALADRFGADGARVAQIVYVQAAG